MKANNEDDNMAAIHKKTLAKKRTLKERKSYLFSTFLCIDQTDKIWLVEFLGEDSKKKQKVSNLCAMLG